MGGGVSVDSISSAKRAVVKRCRDKRGEEEKRGEKTETVSLMHLGVTDGGGEEADGISVLHVRGRLHLKTKPRTGR